jgi:hypothetical protein
MLIRGYSLAQFGDYLTVEPGTLNLDNYSGVRRQELESRIEEV